MVRRRTNRGGLGPKRRLGLRTQREVICDVMLSAAERRAWLTLKELARLTKYGEASISAQLRHLRKPRYGAFRVEKRPRDGETSVCVAHDAPVWEYQVRSSRFGVGGSKEVRGRALQAENPSHGRRRYGRKT